LRELFTAEREIDEEISKVENQLKFLNPHGTMAPEVYAEKKDQLVRKREALLQQKKLVAQWLNQSVETGEKAIVAKPVDQGEEAREEVGKDKSPSPSEARARAVATIVKELGILKPQMYGESDYQSLEQQNPGFLAFAVAAKRPDLRTKVLNLQDHRRFYRLAQELAAAYRGRELSTLQTDWKKHKPKEFRRRSS
jgi:hypothetical protein